MNHHNMSHINAMRELAIQAGREDNMPTFTLEENEVNGQTVACFEIEDCRGEYEDFARGYIQGLESDWHEPNHEEILNQCEGFEAFGDVSPLAYGCLFIKDLGDGNLWCVKVSTIEDEQFAICIESTLLDADCLEGDEYNQAKKCCGVQDDSEMSNALKAEVLICYHGMDTGEGQEWQVPLSQFTDQPNIWLARQEQCMLCGYGGNSIKLSTYKEITAELINQLNMY